MISSSVSSTSSGVKRGFASLLPEFQAATTEVTSLFDMLKDVDFSVASTNENTSRVLLYSELIDLDQLIQRKSFFLVPTTEPDILVGGCDIEFIASAPSLVCSLEADLSKSGGGFLVRVVGEFVPADGPTVMDDLKNIRLVKPPAKFWVAKPSDGPLPTVFEDELRTAVLSAGGKKTKSLPFAPTISVSSGTSGRDDGGVVKKASRVETVDMNGDIRIVINKEDAQKRVTLLGGLLREMHPDRFNLFCRDYSYEVATFREEARRQKENKVMRNDDSCYSVVRMRNVQDLEVWTNPEVFSVWILGHWKTDDWTFSLRNFTAPMCTGWDKTTDYQGRKNLKIALENWIDFQRIFKGEAFHGALDALFQLWDAPGDPMSSHDNMQLQYHLEYMIRTYFYELCRTTGTVCCTVAGQALRGQSESVALLKALANALAASISNGVMETSPAHRFYQTNSHYESIKNKFTSAGGGRGQLPLPLSPDNLQDSDATKPGKGRGRGRDPNWIDVKPLCHMNGLCLWHLAGKLGLVNAKSKAFFCKETGFKHSDLTQVTFGKVQSLLSDDAFMGVTLSEDLKDRVRQAVVAKRHLFKK